MVNDNLNTGQKIEKVYTYSNGFHI